MDYRGTLVYAGTSRKATVKRVARLGGGPSDRTVGGRERIRCDAIGLRPLC